LIRKKTDELTMRRITRLMVALLGLLSVAATAAELPELVFPEGVGVNIHFVTGHTNDLDMIAAAGFKFVRMDFSWGATERTKGEYIWGDYEELTANLEKHGLRAIYILDYSNDLYEEKVPSVHPITHEEQRATASPQHPESVAAFARWAAAAAQHFRGRGVVWELWNEPNISFWKPKPDVKQYSALALAAAKAIRHQAPRAKIIGPATSGFDWPFMEEFLKSGVLEYLDGVSVHPYRDPHQAPETVANDYKKLRELIGRCSPNGGRNIPIISGEWGYSSSTSGVLQEVQAQYLVRQQMVNLLNEVPLSIWYDWKNDGTDRGENEHNFGTVSNDLKPKSAYEAVRTLTHELSGYRILRRAETDSRDYVLVCVNNSGGCKVVAWTAGKAHSIGVEMPFKSVHRVSGIEGLGKSLMPKVKDGNLIFKIEPMPKYFTFE
jgi:polysaccharide biosynthesis protein PslG